MHGPGLGAGHELPGAAGTRGRRSPRRSRRGRDRRRSASSSPPGWVSTATAVPEGVLGTEDRVGHDLRGHGVADRLVVERAVRLDVGQRRRRAARPPVPPRGSARPGRRPGASAPTGPRWSTARWEARPKPARSRYEGWAPIATPRRAAAATALRQHRSPTGVRARGDVGRGDDRPAGPRRRRRPPRGRRSGRSAWRPPDQATASALRPTRVATTAPVTIDAPPRAPRGGRPSMAARSDAVNGAAPH